jgi:hypothetical protein
MPVRPGLVPFVLKRFMISVMVEVRNWALKRDFSVSSGVSEEDFDKAKNARSYSQTTHSSSHRYRTYIPAARKFWMLFVCGSSFWMITAALAALVLIYWKREWLWYGMV